MYPKFNALMKFYKYENYSNLYRDLYKRFSWKFEYLSLNQATKEFKNKYELSSCYTMDAIADLPEYREAFESMVDELIEKKNLSDSIGI